MGVFSSFLIIGGVLLKTKVGFVTLKEAETNQYGQNDEWYMRVRTADGMMMVNRLIQLFSQYSRKQLSYDPMLEVEIAEGYVQKMCVGFSIVTILKNDRIAEEFADAVFGPDDQEIDDIYAFFVQRTSSYLRFCITDWLRHGIQHSVSTIALNSLGQLFRDYDDPDEESYFALLKNLLKARRRIKKFNLRYAREAEMVLAPSEDEYWDK